MSLCRDLLAAVVESRALMRYGLAGAGGTWAIAPDYSTEAAYLMLAAPLVHDILDRLHKRLEAQGK